MPEVSVIIPVYNAEKFISTAIQSAICTTDLPVEVIVVDDGSTDESLSIARRFADRVRLITQSNQGACAARNTGLREARGRFLKFLDADDYLLPGALEAQYTHALSLGSREFSFGRVMRHVETCGRLMPHAARDARLENEDRLEDLLLDPPAISAMLYPAPMIRDLNGFDERLVKRQDDDLFTRALFTGYLPVACGVPTFAYRSHDDSNRVSRRASREAFVNQLEMFERQVDVLTQAVNSDHFESLRNALAPKIWVTARHCLRCGFDAEALSLFRLSESLGSRAARKGRLPYRILVGLLGPILAERILSRAKALSR